MLNLWFGDDFDSHLVAFEGALFGVGRASVAEMAAAHFVPKVIVSDKMLGVSEVFIQGQVALAALGDWGLVRLDGAMAASEQRPDVLRRRRRREGALEDSERRGAEAGVGRRWVLEQPRAVEGEAGRGFGRCVAFAVDHWVFGIGSLVFNGLSMTQSHGIPNPTTDSHVSIWKISAGGPLHYNCCNIFIPFPQAEAQFARRILKLIDEITEISKWVSRLASNSGEMMMRWGRESPERKQDNRLEKQRVLLFYFFPMSKRVKK